MTRIAGTPGRHQVKGLVVFHTPFIAEVQASSEVKA